MDIGNIILIITLALAVVNLVLLTRAAGGDNLSLITAERVQYLITIFILFASVYLLTLILSHRFDFAYVYNNSSTEMSAVYLIASFWAGHEGSMLLWLLFLCFIAVAVIKLKERHENVILAVINLKATYMLVMLLVESPFAKVWEKYSEATVGMMPSEGAGMNPLLMDPWMLAHPPVLFVGYAAAAVPFGIALSGIMNREYSALVTSGYRWVLFSFVVLGLGIFMGGYWAYKVLGWGGYWGWDPVENSSLIPWIVCLALIHGIIIQRRKGGLVRTNMILSVLFFVLVLTSAYLTRSGIISDFSVHSFTDQGLGMILLSMVLIFLLIGLALVLAKFKTIEYKPLNAGMFTWENITVFGIITLMLYGFIILIGTLMPVLSGFTRSVSADFYNTLSIPFGLIILGLMLLSMIPARDRSISRGIIIGAAVMAVLFSVLFNIAFNTPVTAYLFSAVAVFMIFYHSAEIFYTKGNFILPSRIAHIGVAVFVIGVIASGYHSTSQRATLFEGSKQNVGPASLTFKGVEDVDIMDQQKLRFTLERGSSSKEITTLYYFSERMNSLYREPHIEYGFFGDIYIIPERYQSGHQKVSHLVLEQGKESEFTGLTFKFEKFDTGKMMDDRPSVGVKLKVNGSTIVPVYRVRSGKIDPLPVNIPGTGRSIYVTGIDIERKLAAFHVTPGDEVEVPPDSVLVEVSVKRLIWFVWLGTVLVSIGGAAALPVNRKRSGKD